MKQHTPYCFDKSNPKYRSNYDATSCSYLRNDFWEPYFDGDIRPSLMNDIRDQSERGLDAQQKPLGISEMNSGTVSSANMPFSKSRGLGVLERPLEAFRQVLKTVYGHSRQYRGSIKASQEVGNRAEGRIASG